METSELRSRIEWNHRLYWEGKEPDISDREFDELLLELKRRCPDDPLIERIGLKVERGTEYHHRQPMLSLDKVYSYEELEKWVKKVSRSKDEEFLVQYKFDGIACKYENGHLATRGDGNVGEDITRKLVMVRCPEFGIDRKISKYHSVESFRNIIPKYPGDTIGTLIGELVYPLDKFKENHFLNGKEYKHPRNFVAGVVNRKGDCEPGLRLDYVVYSMSPVVSFLSSEFNPELWDGIKRKLKENQIYPADGLVVTLEDKTYGESLGRTQHHPLCSIAYKEYQAEETWSKVREIVWQVGKDRITPVANIEPVELDGVTISRVTLHNADFVRKENVKVGDSVQIERAGQVIPHVVKVRQETSGRCTVPKVCPSCGSPLEDDGTNLFCISDSCPERRINRLLGAVDALGIEGMGVELIKALNASGRLIYAFQLFRLKPEDISTLEGMGEVSAKKIIESIAKAKTMKLETLLTALGIPGAGKAVCKEIASRMTAEEIMSCLDTEGFMNHELSEKIQGLNLIGLKRSQDIEEWLFEHRNEFIRLYRRVNIISPEEKLIDCKGSVCFTGKMPEKRSHYKELAEKNGYEVADSVSKGLSMLVVADKDELNSSKSKKAQKLGIVIVPLEEWVDGLANK